MLLNKIYRKSAFKIIEEKDTSYGFIYGISSDRVSLDELRIKVCDTNRVLNDTLLISKLQFAANRYDYTLDNNLLTVIAYNSKKETHKTYYTISRGALINETFIPNTIFKRQDLRPDRGRRVIIYDNFENKTVSINGKSTKLTGKIHKFYGSGKSCPSYMMIKLDNKQIIKSGFVQVRDVIYNTSTLHELKNSDLIISKDCFSDAYFPKEEPIFLKKQVYIEYL